MRYRDGRETTDAPIHPIQLRRSPDPTNRLAKRERYPRIRQGIEQKDSGNARRASVSMQAYMD